MAPMDDALAAIKALKPGEKLVYQKIADQYGVDRLTLSRQHKRVQAPQTVKDSSQQKLTPQQEAELIKYIEELTARRIPPTREIIRNFASAVA
jgi:predicted ABC-class ATPase